MFCGSGAAEAAMEDAIPSYSLRVISPFDNSSLASRSSLVAGDAASLMLTTSCSVRIPLD
jgi:hypothetical protein